MARLAGKSVLVAGAGGGIGEAAAEGLAREGAAVVCGDLDHTAEEVTAEHIQRDRPGPHSQRYEAEG
jgi:NAD(P)-dependent dehydrogenase (short-subunit alcohol dehydrogenase family)